MIKEVELVLSPEEAQDKQLIEAKAIKKARVQASQVTQVIYKRRSIDARKRPPKVRLRVEVFVKEVPPVQPTIIEGYPDVSNANSILIIGAGPAGYFAGLECIEQGYRPIILEQGKDVRARRRDLRAIQQLGEVNPISNYCFGEGGAGTYSDGKLYTRSHKRGNIQKVLELLVEHGAKEDILIDAHPHIGSNKLPGIVSNIRETIERCGGQVHFETRVIDLLYNGSVCSGVVTADHTKWEADAIILATGHSARPIYQLLHEKQITVEAKPFALGVRVEHPQPLIDGIQYGQNPRGEYLPASSYRLACQVENRGVFSFCMCPGGLVVPAATAPNELVVNGMSLSRRDSPYSNSGVVVAVEIEDLHEMGFRGVFAGLEFQRSVEKAMFEAGDGSQKAPAQRLPDFISGKLSKDLPDSSYIPGLFSARIDQLLPTFIASRLKKGFTRFGQMMKGYMTADAVVIGTESRTSSPLRIPRNPKTLMHDDAIGLFPCGEGAGFAGGILSAAMDGQRVASAVSAFLQTKTVA